VLKLLTDRIELSTPHGRVATGVLITQDLAAIGFLLAVPFLEQWGHGALLPRAPEISDVLQPLATIALAALAFFAAQRAIPWVMGRASRTGSREAFLIGVVLVALGAAYLTARLGGSLAIGAFLAGLFLAESDLRTQIAADVLPFRDVLASVFFVAIGMSLDPRVLIEMPGIVALSTVGLVGIKLLLTVVALRVARVTWRVAFGTGFVLAQVGEFSFVLAQAADVHLLGPVGAQAFTAGAVFSLALTPILVASAPRWALALDLKRAAWLAAERGASPPDTREDDPPRSALLHDHVVVAGAGLNGQNMARVLRAVRLPHVVVDLNPDHLQPLAAAGSMVLVGDIARPMVQRAAGVTRARAMVLALSDHMATRHACRMARELSARVFIIARTRLLAEIDELHGLGADQVIPEEFETSIEIFTSVLREFHVPNNVIQGQILLLRQERYSILRGRKLPATVVEQLDAILEAGATDTFLLLQHSPAVGAALGQLGLADDVRVVAVVRGGQATSDPPPDLVLRVGDTIVLTGTHAGMERAFARLS